MALTSIDVGPVASDRGTVAGGEVTRVSRANPANATGYITVVQIYCPGDPYSGITGVEVASFDLVASGPGYGDLTTRDYVSLSDCSPGLNTYRAPLDFRPFAISSGDYIGFKARDGYVDGDDAGGSGFWTISGDYIPCTEETFTEIANWELSIYGSGYDVIKGWINVGDVWKLIEDVQINIGDVWKTVSDVNINIADAWKDTWLT